jgi:hypothetical protein
MDSTSLHTARAVRAQTRVQDHGFQFQLSSQFLLAELAAHEFVQAVRPVLSLESRPTQTLKMDDNMPVLVVFKGDHEISRLRHLDLNASIPRKALKHAMVVVVTNAKKKRMSPCLALWRNRHADRCLQTRT